MAKGQLIRNLPSHHYGTWNKVGKLQNSHGLNRAQDPSLRVYVPGRPKTRSSQGRPVTKKVRSKPDAQPKQFPAAEWEQVQRLIHASSAQERTLNDERIKQPVVNLKITNASNSDIANAKPAQLTKRLISSFDKRNYGDVPVGQALETRFDEMFGKVVDSKKKKAIFTKNSLSQRISYKQGKQAAKGIHVFNWIKNLFAESAPDKDFEQDIHQLESAINDFSNSSNRDNALRIKSNYGQGSFFELRAELTFEYLKAKGEVVDYKRTVHNSYFDHLGIDYLLRAKVDGELRIFAVQVKSSESQANSFYQPKMLSRYNFRKRQPLNTENQRKGIILLNMNKKSLSILADEISKLITNDAARKEKGIVSIPNFDFSIDQSLEKLKTWQATVEDAFVENATKTVRVA